MIQPSVSVWQSAESRQMTHDGRAAGISAVQSGAGKRQSPAQCQHPTMYTHNHTELTAHCCLKLMTHAPETVARKLALVSGASVI